MVFCWVVVQLKKSNKVQADIVICRNTKKSYFFQVYKYTSNIIDIPVISLSNINGF